MGKGQILIHDLTGAGETAMYRLLTICVSTALLTSCGDGGSGPDPASPSPPISQTAPAPVSSIQVEAVPISATAIKTIITTNLPLPVIVMASVDLVDQAGDDAYIGHSERVTLVSPRTESIIDTGKADKPLPSGNYDVVVTFYPRWGAPDNPRAAALTDTMGLARITLDGSGERREIAELRDSRQAWVMENVVVHTPFDEADFVRRLGSFQKSPATLNNHDAYYFPGADMTMIVNRSRHDVAIWRMGRATS